MAPYLQAITLKKRLGLVHDKPSTLGRDFDRGLERSTLNYQNLTFRRVLINISVSEFIDEHCKVYGSGRYWTHKTTA